MDQPPAPFVDKGGRHFAKNQARPIERDYPSSPNVSYTKFDEFRDTTSSERVDYIDEPSEPSFGGQYASRSNDRVVVRSRPLVDQNQEQIHFGGKAQEQYRQQAAPARVAAPRAKPVVDGVDEYEQRRYVAKPQQEKRQVRQVASARSFPKFEVKEKPLFARGGGASGGYNEGYVDLSSVNDKLESFGTKPRAMADIRPLSKPEFQRAAVKMETASGSAPRAVAPKVIAEPKVVVKAEEKVQFAKIPAPPKYKPEGEKLNLQKLPALKKQEVAKPISGAGKKFVKPLEGEMIADFGSQDDGSFNDGIRIAAPEGTPIKAAGSGSVVYSGNQLQGYGNLIIIRHANGYLTAYAHLKELEISKGQSVSKGDVIGHVGKTGNVDQAQLHFGVRKGREPVDPKQFI